MLFICCHPSVAIEARVALMLRVVMGVEVEEIATGFLASPPAVRQRITRAKAKIRGAGIAFELPHRRFWDERADGILMTLELAFTAAYRAGARTELAAEVERLALMLAELLGEAGEVLGLAALVVLARSREAARAEGLPLSEQDATLWDAGRIDRARKLLDRPFDGAPGRFRLLALVHLTHARRLFTGETDWKTIAALYHALARIDPGPTVAIARAVAIGRAGDPLAGLAALPAEVEGHAPWYAARGDLLGQKGEMEGAVDSLRRALELTEGEAPRQLLERRIDEFSRGCGS